MTSADWLPSVLVLMIGCAAAGPAPTPIESMVGPNTADCRPNPHVARAQEQYDRLEFDRAGQTLQRAIEHPRNCKTDLVQIYRLKAQIDAING
jgi:hypothetical protein